MYPRIFPPPHPPPRNYSRFIPDRISNSVHYIDIYENCDRDSRGGTSEGRRGTSSSARGEQIILGEPYFRPKRARESTRIHRFTGWYLRGTRGDRGGAGGRGALFQSSFRELKQIPRTWRIRLLVRAFEKLVAFFPLPPFPPPPSPSFLYHSLPLSPYVPLPSLADRRRNCECRRPCNCESSKENGNFPPNSRRGWEGERGEGGAQPADDDDDDVH